MVFIDEKLEFAEVAIKKLEESGIIRQVDNPPYCSNLVLVPKFKNVRTIPRLELCTTEALKSKLIDWLRNLEDLTVSLLTPLGDSQPSTCKTSNMSGSGSPKEYKMPQGRSASLPVWYMIIQYYSRHFLH